MPAAIEGRDEQLQTDDFEPLIAHGQKLVRELNSLRDKVFNPRIQRKSPEDALHFLTRLHRQLGRLAGTVRSDFGEPPNALVRAEMRRLFPETGRRIAEFNELVTRDVETCNKAAERAGAPTVFSGEPIVIEPARGLE